MKKKGKNRPNLIVGLIVSICGICWFTSLFNPERESAPASRSNSDLEDAILVSESIETETPDPTATTTPAPTETPIPGTPTNTGTPTPTPTDTVTSTPTPIPPTATPLPAITVIRVNDRQEYADIRNNSAAPIDLSGWMLRSEKGQQDCSLGGVINPNEVLRVWARAKDVGNGGFNCQFGGNIWNNQDKDPAVIIDPNGIEIHRLG